MTKFINAISFLISLISGFLLLFLCGSLLVAIFKSSDYTFPIVLYYYFTVIVLFGVALAIGFVRENNDYKNINYTKKDLIIYTLIEIAIITFSVLCAYFVKNALVIEVEKGNTGFVTILYNYSWNWSFINDSIFFYSFIGGIIKLLVFHKKIPLFKDKISIFGCQLAIFTGLVVGPASMIGQRQTVLYYVVSLSIFAFLVLSKFIALSLLLRQRQSAN